MRTADLLTAYAADEGSERLPGDYPPALVRVLCFMWRQGGVVSVGCSPPETTEEPLRVPPCAPSGIGSATLTPLRYKKSGRPLLFMDFFIVAHSGSIVWFSPVCFVSKLGDFLLFFLAYRLGVFCSPPFGVEVFFFLASLERLGFVGFRFAIICCCCNMLLLLRWQIWRCLLRRRRRWFGGNARLRCTSYLTIREFAGCRCSNGML